MKTSGEINIQIPLLMTKDGDDFLISCRPLSIYIKDDSEEIAKAKFEEAIDLLFDRLVEKKSLISFLKSRDILYKEIPATFPSKVSSLQSKRSPVHMPDLQLGNHANLNVPVQLCYA